MKNLPENAYLPYSAEAHSIYRDDMLLGDAYTEEQFREDQSTVFKDNFFLYWDQLRYIEVADGNRCLYDVDGVLYAKSDWMSIDLLWLRYHSSLTGIPTVRLIAVPRNYECSDGTYTVSEGTQYIHSGAIYYPANIRTLILPDTLIYLSPTAIIATEEHPLTVICSPGSVAEEYVKQYGEQYHLLLAYPE